MDKVLAKHCAWRHLCYRWPCGRFSWRRRFQRSHAWPLRFGSKGYIIFCWKACHYLPACDYHKCRLNEKPHQHKLLKVRGTGHQHPSAQVGCWCPVLLTSSNLHWRCFPSSQWRKYSTCTRAACTVWWWLCSDGCMCLVDCGGGSCMLYNYVVVVVVTM